MKVHRFITTVKEGSILEDKEVVHQIRKVLKLLPEEHIQISDGHGRDIEGTIERIDKNRIYLKNIAPIAPIFPKKKVTLYCALLKKENFEVVCQKVTELGVTQIVPIITSRIIKQGFKEERIQKIIREATEQSGLSRVPTFSAAQNFKDAILASKENNDETILFDRSGKSSKATKDTIGIFIGPEGGFTEEEILFAKENGATVVTLGNTVLRGETAAIVGSFWALE
jgi:16S rRNA (uracil1498-N3)-methyltransferase